MRLSVFVILLAVHLSAHGQCLLQPTSIPAGCDAASCPSGFNYWTDFQPAFYVSCSADREYLTVTVHASSAVIMDHFLFKPTETQRYIDLIKNYSQQIRLYAEDQWGDMASAGSGYFGGIETKDFTVYGSRNYMFTFYHSFVTGFELKTSPLPVCNVNDIFGKEKILKANDVNSAQYQCSLYVESLGQSIEQTQGLNGCTFHRCQYFADRKTLVFCEGTLTDDQCYQKADYVWFIGTEYDLSSLPKVIILCLLLLLYFIGLGHGLRT